MTRQRFTLRTACCKPLDGGGEVDALMIGKRCHPRNHIAELVHLLLWRALTNRLGELADLFGQPGDCRRHTALTIAIAVRPLDHVLQFN